MKVDIQSFFASIDLNILQSIVERHLSNEFYRWLFKMVLWHRATQPGNYELRSPISEWDLIPPYKSLFHVPKHKGLPIGNLTSQFWANIYLNELDQFIAHRLKKTGILFWQRYVDDLVLLSSSKDVLVGAAAAIQEFLTTKLALSLNPRKTSIQPVSAGIDHLGYFIKPDHVLVRQRVVNHFRQSCLEQLDQKNHSPKKLVATVNSFLGYFNHANSYRLRRAGIQKILSHPHASPLISADGGFEKILLNKDPAAESSAVQKERQIKREFEMEFPSQLQDAPAPDEYLRRWLPMADVSI